MQEITKLKDGRGYTTGSCATAAAKAATIGLLSGEIPKIIDIDTPKGIKLCLGVNADELCEEFCSAYIQKDSGEDPDVTNGTLIYAKAEKITQPKVEIDGGVGVGRVTMKGLGTEIGKAAINKTPIKTITKEVSEVMEHLNYEGGIKITISVPDGERLAAKTYNPRLGVVGGISIIGTTGIVEPMSSKALIDTIKVELGVIKETGAKSIVITPGNYGKTFIDGATKIPEIRVVKASNFLGDAIDMAKSMGFEKILLIGHIGKFIKVAGGVFNTHSNNCDARMEILTAAGIKAGAGNHTLQKILDCISTEEAITLLKDSGYFDETMQFVIEKFDYHIRRRFDSENIGGMIYSNDHGLLKSSENAESLLSEIIK